VGLKQIGIINIGMNTLGLNRTSVGLKHFPGGGSLDHEVLASIEPAWD